MAFLLSSCRKEDKNEFGQLNNIVFNTSLTYGTMEDQDGNTYKTIKIGDQTWMAENLKTTKYNDGTSIPNIKDDDAWTTCVEGYCWFNNDISFKKVYGALYSPGTIKTGKLAPTGWHIPNDLEWETLRQYAGGEYGAGFNLRESGVLHWDWSSKHGYTSSNNAINALGFTALPGGSRSPDGLCLWMLSEGHWWSCNQNGDNIYLSNWSMFTDDSFLSAEFINYNLGVSVRCVKNN